MAEGERVTREWVEGEDSGMREGTEIKAATAEENEWNMRRWRKRKKSAANKKKRCSQRNRGAAASSTNRAVRTR